MRRAGGTQDERGEPLTSMRRRRSGLAVFCYEQSQMYTPTLFPCIRPETPMPDPACIPYTKPQNKDCPCWSSRIHSSPRLSLTFFLHLRLNSLGSSLHILAASTFAGLSSFGLLSMDITDNRIVSGDCTGDHLSDTDS